MTETQSITGSRRPNRRRRPRALPRIVAGGAAALLLTAGVLGYRASAEPSQARYRTVVAAPATVSQTISLSGTVRHVSQVSTSFPVGGMVTSVTAKAGDTVAAGQPLATIDSGPLQNAVLDAEAQWRAAVSKLDLDQTAYNAASSTTTTTTSTKAAAAGAAGGSGGGASRAASADSTQGAPGGQGSASTRPSGGTGDSAGPLPSGSARPTGSVQDAAKAIQALQTTLGSIQTHYETLVAQCLPAGLPSTLPSDLPTALPSVVTVTATKTVTATATKTVTVTAPAASGTASSSATSSATSTAPAASSASGTGSASATTTSTASTTPTGSTSPSTSPSLPSPTGQPVLPSNLPVSAECQQAIIAMASLPQTLSDQLAAVETTLVGAQASLTAQAAALQAQAAELQKQGAAMQQQAAALQAQAAALQQQAAALQQQAAAAAAQGAAAAAKMGAAGVAKVSEATLITDRANVAATELALQQAKDRLAGATVTSPIAGVVASLPWVAGQQTTATASAIVIGPGAIEITVPVALAQRPQVEVGQAATISSPISQTALDGKVTRIGLLPVSSGSNAAAAAAAAGASAAAGGTTTSNVAYPVVVTVPILGDGLPEGSRVQVGIVTSKVAAAVTVPSSAVTPTSLTAGTLQVLANGVAERRTVQIGISGAGITQIVSGVAAGESVVVADMEVPLPGVTIATGRPSQQGNQGQVPGGQQTGGANQGQSGQGQQPGQGQPTR